MKQRIMWDSESFNKKMKEIHPNYDFSKSEYISSKSKVSYICNEHGYVETTAFHLLKGIGCAKCGFDKTNKNKRLTVKEIQNRIFKIHGNKYEYVNLNVNNLEKDKVDIICKIHGKFKQSLKNHIKGQGCPKCGLSKRKSGGGWSHTSWLKKGIKSKQFTGYKLYVLKMEYDNDVFYKIGKTFRDINIRFKQLPNNIKYEKFMIYKGDGLIISKLEKEIFKELKKHKYKPKIMFQGFSECFKLSEKEIQKIKEICKLKNTVQVV